MIDDANQRTDELIADRREAERDAVVTPEAHDEHAPAARPLLRPAGRAAGRVRDDHWRGSSHSARPPDPLPLDPVGRYKAGRGQARLGPRAEGNDVEVRIGGAVRAGVELEHLLLRGCPRIEGAIDRTEDPSH